MSATSPQVRLTTEDLHRIKWLCGGVLVLVACWSIIPLDFGVGLLLPVFALTVALFLAKPGLSTRLPQAALRVTPPFIALFVAADFFLSAPDLLPAILRMMLILLLYRALPHRTGREDLQLLLLAFFCIILSGVLTVSLLFAVQILLFALISMCLMLVVSIAEVSSGNVDPNTLWKGFRWKKFIVHVWRGINLKLAFTGLAFFGFLVVLSSLIFVIIPRFELERTFQLFQLNTQARSGFSERVEIGNVTEITEDNSIALRIDVPSRESIPSVPYWRMLVLDHYAEGRFEVSSWMLNTNESSARRSLTDQRFSDSAFEPGAGDATDGPWVFYMEGGISRFFPLPGYFRSLEFTQREDLQVFSLTRNIARRSVSTSWMSFRLRELSWTSSFRVSSAEKEALDKIIAAGPFQVEPGESRNRRSGPEIDIFERSESDAERTPYPQTTLKLPVSDDEREILRHLLAEAGWEGEGDLDQFGSTVIPWLNQRFQYSLQPDVPPGGGDPLVRWLNNGGVGHCELFAGGFLLLAREAGFPTRMVTGFTGGSWNEVEDFFVVRNRHAHAWVELYDPERSAWQRFDPTPGARDPSQADALGDNVGVVGSEQGWDAWLDSLRILWYRRVINFDDRSQEELVDGLRARVQELRDGINEWVEGVGARLREILAQPLGWQSWLPFVPAIVATVIGFAGFYWRNRILSFFAKLFRRDDYDPARRQAGRVLARLSPVLREAEGVLREQGSLLIEGKDLEATLQEARFGREPPPAARTDEYARRANALRRKLTREIRRTRNNAMDSSPKATEL